MRALGDLTMLPEDLQRSVAKVVKFSQNNTKYVMEACQNTLVGLILSFGFRSQFSK